MRAQAIGSRYAGLEYTLVSRGLFHHFEVSRVSMGSRICIKKSNTSVAPPERTHPFEFTRCTNRTCRIYDTAMEGGHRDPATVAPVVYKSRICDVSTTFECVHLRVHGRNRIPKRFDIAVLASLIVFFSHNSHLAQKPAVYTSFQFSWTRCLFK
jgi:hypothetical protein